METSTILICIAIAVIVSLCIVLAMKSALKTARWNSYVANYVDSGTFEITSSDDRYIRTDVTRTKINNDSKN